MQLVIDEETVNQYRQKVSPLSTTWGGLSEFVYRRTYSRRDNPLSVGPNEEWADTVARVINGMYDLQRTHCFVNERPWDEAKAKRSALEAYDLAYNLKWSPPGRGLWMMGTPFIHERGDVEALNNCAYISTLYIQEEKGDVFRWIMEMLMLGVGVGFDVRGANKLVIQAPEYPSKTFIIEDTRESWAESIEALFNSFVPPDKTSFTTHMQAIIFDYSRIRPAGLPIKGFGGVSSGPEPLIQLHEAVRNILENVSKDTGRLTSRAIVDIANLIGRCVIAGNVRRSAEIALGNPFDSDFVELKNPEVFPERNNLDNGWGWASNNTVLITDEDSPNYVELAKRTWENGEPGYLWIDNAKQFGRMNGVIDLKDSEVMGTNPCSEQMLAHREMCTLVEVYLPNIKSRDELGRVLKFAYLYGKSVTLSSQLIRDPKSRRIMTTNRRIGVSITGIAQKLAEIGMDELKEWMDYGYRVTEFYDRMYSNDWLDVPMSVRRTTVKPSGTVSLLAGVTPGVHHPWSRFQIRRVQVADNSPLIQRAIDAGLHVEPKRGVLNTAVIAFPVDIGEGVRAEHEVSLREQLELAATVQRLWSDNGVSLTGTFDKEETSPEDIALLLEEFKSKLKAVSLLPRAGHGYDQAPYEAITEDQYRLMAAKVKPIDWSGLGDIHEEETEDRFCTTDACEIEGLEQVELVEVIPVW